MRRNNVFDLYEPGDDNTSRLITEKKKPFINLMCDCSFFVIPYGFGRSGASPTVTISGQNVRTVQGGFAK